MLSYFRSNRARTNSSEDPSSDRNEEQRPRTAGAALKEEPDWENAFQIRNEILHDRPNSSSGAPVLPPIPRVASQYGPVPPLANPPADNSQTVQQEPQYLSRVTNRHHPAFSRNGFYNNQVQGDFQPSQHVHQSSVPEDESRHAGHSMNTLVETRQSTEATQYSTVDPRHPVYRSETMPILQQPTLHTSQSGTRPPIPQPASKPKLNRLNPMSILARRRTEKKQVQGPEESFFTRKTPYTSNTTLPNDYDPRIRGKIVHDFSAPRPKRNISYEDTSRAGQSGLSVLTDQARASQEAWKSAEHQHTPVFKEHFDDDVDNWRADGDDIRNQNTTGILERMPQESFNPKLSSMPAFARNLPEDVTPGLRPLSTSPGPPPVPPKSPKDQPIRMQGKREGEEQEAKQEQEEQEEQAKSLLKPSSELSSVVTPEKSFRAPSNSGLISTPPSALPKHMKSTSSRFSFDLAGKGSAAQEKLLEERHRQKMAKKVRVSTMTQSSMGVGEDEDDYDYDNMDFDDGLEERIPGVNADDDDDEYGYGGGGMTVQPMYQHQNAALPPPSFGDQSVLFRIEDVSPTKEESGAGAAFDTDLTPRPTLYQSEQQSNDQTPTRLAKTKDYQLQGIPTLDAYDVEQVITDDLYFDDPEIRGEIMGFAPGEESHQFDESIFDDDSNPIYGMPLRDIKQLQGPPEAASNDSSQRSTRPLSQDSESNARANNRESADTSRTSVQPAESALPARKSSLASHSAKSASLTHDNLAAWHDALASQVNRAAAEGRFDRRFSTDNDALDDKPLPTRITFDEAQLAQKPSSTTHEIYNYVDSADNFNYDDLDEDDEFIAAANAEALENDDEGFYGREFGFFASAANPEAAEFSHGGYFGPGAAANGVKRSHSGRANFQEPSLTPITERSEWSQRNSVISLAKHPSYGSGSVERGSGVGLAQLADQLAHSGEGESDMSLEALMKLRRGWGGSSNSQPNSKSSSPQLYSLQNLQQNSGGRPGSGNVPMLPSGSTTTLYGIDFSNHSPHHHSHSHSSGSGPLSMPSLRLQTHNLPLHAHPNNSAILSATTPATNSGGGLQDDGSPLRRGPGLIKGQGNGHSRNSSGASVSYIKEIGEEGEDRWMVERRGVGGEVWEREWVEGGRI
jgi:hypothetical protein